MCISDSVSQKTKKRLDCITHDLLLGPTLLAVAAAAPFRHGMQRSRREPKLSPTVCIAYGIVKSPVTGGVGVDRRLMCLFAVEMFSQEYASLCIVCLLLLFVYHFSAANVLHVEKQGCGRRSRLTDPLQRRHTSSSCLD